ncbi:hypothetical protein [Butyrivibrio sp. XPD2002]|uniref:hypothetical protein n=1 Tax=Butyrivibrio sp. XPD2002 TaxID=1280665 RepID=UPI000416B8C5|nr:hypothetical protein [Butyrivibrio sp. XPD2002]
MDKLEEEIKGRLIDFHILDNEKEMSALSPLILQHLRKIQSVINRFESERLAAEDRMKGTKLSANKIASEAQIARQTLYNNEILKEYVEQSILKQKANDPSQIIKELRQEIKEREEIISKLVARDAQEFMYKAKIKELESIVVGHEKQIEALKNKIEILKVNK